MTSPACKKQTTPFNGHPQARLLGSGSISTSNHHESVNDITIDGHTLFFTRSDLDFLTARLYQSTFANGQWGPPEVLPFGESGYDASLKIISQGSQQIAFFTSKRNPLRPNLSSEWNIWRVQKYQEVWGKPEVLPPPVNSDSMECCLVLNQNGDAYFASNRSGTWDIYYTAYQKGSFGPVSKLDTLINSPFGEWPGYINAENDLLIFSSIRKSGYGGDDLYYTRRVEGGWTPAALLDNVVNTRFYEDSPLLTSDHGFLLFSSWKPVDTTKAVSNIYFVKNPIK